jgi:hypothetical protein
MPSVCGVSGALVGEKGKAFDGHLPVLQPFFLSNPIEADAHLAKTGGAATASFFFFGFRISLPIAASPLLGHDIPPLTRVAGAANKNERPRHLTKARGQQGAGRLSRRNSAESPTKLPARPWSTLVGAARQKRAALNSRA